MGGQPTAWRSSLCSLRLMVAVIVVLCAPLQLVEGGRPLATVGKHGLTISSPRHVTFNDENGRVGIGTDEPDATLHVSRAAKVTGLVRLGSAGECSDERIGSLRYHDEHKRVQICSGERWVPISSAPVGTENRIAPSTCDEIFHQNPGLTTGSYFLRDVATGVRQESFCVRPDAATQVGGSVAAGPPERVGCTIPIAVNYERYATVANNSMCMIYGCDQPEADNFLSIVTHNDGSCFTALRGCMNENAPNYNAAANEDDGTCFEMCIQSNPCMSCLEARDHQKTTGVYWIGGGVENASETFCLMDYDGGGWSLIMKSSPSSTFQYSHPAWTQPTSYNTDTAIVFSDGSLNMMTDAKYDVFNWLPAIEYMAFFPEGDGSTRPDFRLHIGPFNTSTALEFFQTERVLDTDPTSRADFQSMYFSTQDTRQEYGINMYGNIRWGYSWMDSRDRILAGGGIGREQPDSAGTGFVDAGTFGAGDWFQAGGTAAPQGQRKFSVQIFAR